VCEFNDGPIGRAAAAALVGECTLGCFAYRIRGLLGQALSLGKGHARTILGDFSHPDGGVETGSWAHISSIGTNQQELNP
jgi:hypothetical protein